ncbi:MAG: molybdopterin-dependent oxidoreductase [Actinomycetota bacterium]
MIRPDTAPDRSEASHEDRRSVRIAGACATAVALAWLWVVAAVLADAPFVVTTVADAVIRTTPGGVSTFFIDLLAHWALRLLSLGVLAGVVFAGAEALWRLKSATRPRPLVTGAVLAVGAALATLLLPQSGESDPLVTAIALAIAALLYAGFAGSVYETLTASHDPNRRTMLRFGVGSAFAVALGGGALGWLLRSFSGPDRDVDLVRPVMAAALPDDGAWPDIEGQTPEVTPADAHYVVDIDLITPSVEADGWSLRVAGLVDRAQDLTFESLQRRFEIVEEYSTMCCISNEVGGNLIGTSAWGGVRLRDVLDSAGVQEGAVDVVLRATDGYSDSIPIEVALDEHSILCVSQNGEALLQEHGFPCRLRVPAIYGMKNVKWLTEIEVVPHDYQGYWMRRGWSDEAVVKTESRIDVVGTDGRARVGEATWIAGIAWAGARGVSKVEVSVDDGPWREAMLKDPINERCWRLWAYRWTPERAGSLRVECRAVDGSGAVQTAREADPHPAGASGYPYTEVAVD